VTLAATSGALANIEIDELVYGLYRLAEAEIGDVEAHFDEGVAKAA
jgi:hypothetical protein